MKKILVIGACGQIGTELTLVLRGAYGESSVIASDVNNENDYLKGTGPFLPLDKKEIFEIIFCPCFNK